MGCVAWACALPLSIACWAGGGSGTKATLSTYMQIFSGIDAPTTSGVYARTCALFLLPALLLLCSVHVNVKHAYAVVAMSWRHDHDCSSN